MTPEDVLKEFAPDTASGWYTAPEERMAQAILDLRAERDDWRALHERSAAMVIPGETDSADASRYCRRAELHGHCFGDDK